MSAFHDVADLSPYAIWNGVVGRVVPAESATVAVIELEPDAIVPEHAHENEQIGVLVQGSLRFRIADEEREVEAGGAWCVPPNVPHEVQTGPEGAVIVEIFVPARADWEGLERRPPSAPEWPVRSERL